MSKKEMNFWGKKSVFFISGLCIIIVGFIGACWWFLKPTYVPLLQQNDKNIQANVINILSTSNIPYVIKNNTIEVEESKVGEAKIALDKGGLSNPDTVGFELFNETDYGMSDFAQKINFQRALEGELARSIMTMDGMKYARVHLTPEKDKIYEVDKATAKASVVIETLNNNQLSKDTVEGIQNLVSSAVNGLEAKNVVLLNQQGEIISNNLNTSSSLKRSDDLETKIESKVRNILYQSFNINKVSVSAHVQVNFDKRKVVREKPILSDAGILLLKKKETSSTTLGGENTNSSQKDSSQDNEYAIGKEISEIEYGSERISNINVGVIVPSTLDFTQLQNIQQVLEAGLGIDKKRGDRLVLVSSMVPVEPISDQKAKSELLKVNNEKNDIVESKLSPFMIIVISSLGMIVLFLILKYLRKNPIKSEIETDSLSDEEREKILVNLKYWLGKN
ncbi:flagellar basal-body MS-ring/collar protein FliF [Acinetobacter sp. AHP123]|uniref:flagellar basal-body MS-ring/collar protein FliF n=1 Tax=Acinetobacter sp. AHP123 TaxID=2913495 RepID=UPI002076016B|nr:flagellar basal-body MS-ring/collar protein FliF [Acinetobacter sp. AHP123]